MKKLLLSVICFMFSLASIAQINNINIQLIDTTSEDAIKNASLLLSSANGNQYSSISSLSGHALLENIAYGEYTLEISHVGYYFHKQTVKVNKYSDIKPIEIILIPLVVPLTQVVIEDVKNEGITNVSYLHRRNIENSSVRDIGELLRSTPNVSGIRKGSLGVDPVVRGMKYSQINVIINNGLQIEGGCPNRMDPALSHIEAEDIDNIEVYKGPFALKYGPSLGGVIRVNTLRAQAYDSTQFHVGIFSGYESDRPGFKNHISLNGGNETVFFLLSGGYKQFGDYTAANGVVVPSSFTKQNYRGQIGLNISEHQKFFVSYEKSTASDVDYAALPMDMRSDETNLIMVDYEYSDTSRLVDEFKLSMFNSTVHHVMDNFERSFSDTVAAETQVYTEKYGVNADASMGFENSKLDFRFDWVYSWKTGSRMKNMIMQAPKPTGFYPTKNEPIWTNANMNNYGLYIQYSYNVGKFDLMAAVRGDLNIANSEDISVQNMMGTDIYFYSEDSTGTTYTNLSFNLGTKYKLSKNFNISLLAGRGVRSPDLTERYIILLPVGFDKFDYLGNPQLLPEANHEVDLIFDMNTASAGSFELTVFGSYITNYISARILPSTEQKPLSSGVLGVKEFYNADYAYFAGFEFSYKTPTYPIGAVLTAAYTAGTIGEAIGYTTNSSGVVTDEVIYENDPLYEIPPFELRANLFANLYLNDNLVKPSITFRGVADQNRVSEATVETTTPGFYLIDFALSYRMNSMINVSAGVNNILDRAYYEHLNRRMIGSTQPIWEQGRYFFANLIINI